ncbi:hypothetical protein MBLNU459_g2746t1 [Dothideomycetes sp. NU459]
MRFSRRHVGALPSSLVLLLCASIAPAAAWPNETPPPSSGLVIEYTKPQTCNRPTRAGDDISVHYRGTLQSDGSEFDASYNRGVPFTFKLGAGMVIKGWEQGLLDMCVGEGRKLIIPPELAYGNRNLGPIPAGSTLIFDTELIQIEGVPAETVKTSVALLPSSTLSNLQSSTLAASATALESTAASETAALETSIPPPPPEKGHGDKDGPHGEHPPPPSECRLLGPFALIVQAALGAIALLSLVFKRWRERPRRPMNIWLFDVSKQVLGTFLLHLANLAMSMFSSGDFQQRKAQELAAAVQADDGRMPNPCSFYLLNLAIDTTIGIPVLVVSLRVLHKLFLRTPLANPPESIKSGHYGQPVHVSWWLKQCLIYFLGLFGMKLFVFFLFAALPWLAWVGDWALRWTEGNEALQIAFVMFIFPVAMNAIQYYIIDSFIKQKPEDGDDTGFQRVPTSEEDSQDGEGRENTVEIAALEEEENKQSKSSKVNTKEEGLAEANLTPVPAYDPSTDGEASSGTSPRYRA